MTKRRTSGARRSKARIILLLCCIAVVGLLGVQGTISWLTTKTDPVQNTFTPASVSCAVEEEFNNNVKTDIKVKNTGATTAYVRVRLVTYRVNAAGDPIGGKAVIPTGLELGEGWKQSGNYYYYLYPVEPKDMTATPLFTSSITLVGNYSDDADGGRQVIEVLAEAIQSTPAQAVYDAWGLTVSSN